MNSITMSFRPKTGRSAGVRIFFLMTGSGLFAAWRQIREIGCLVEKILLSPAWIRSVSWADRKVGVVVTTQEVKDCPKCEPSAPVDRDHEAWLYDFYGRPKYWEAVRGIEWQGIVLLASEDPVQEDECCVPEII